MQVHQVSSYLLCYWFAPSFDNGIVAKHQGGSLPSMPHIEMTVDMLRDFGATVEVNSANQSWSVKPGALHGKDLVIEPDLSNAAPFLSLAMVCGGSVTIADWPQGDNTTWRSTPFNLLQQWVQLFQ
jgi:3-phosphoshikimate 1-carboxyvinyltransferase